jgi:hypothetical protein
LGEIEKEIHILKAFHFDPTPALPAGEEGANSHAFEVPLLPSELGEGFRAFRARFLFLNSKIKLISSNAPENVV